MLAGFFILVAPAVIAQPHVVDDAGITEPGACQPEAWADRDQGWLAPACAPLSRTEFALEIGVLREPHGEHTQTDLDPVAEAKAQLLPDAPGRISLAVVGGIVLHPGEASPLEEAYVFAPVTLRAAGVPGRFDVVAGVGGGLRGGSAANWLILGLA